MTDVELCRLIARIERVELVPNPQLLTIASTLNHLYGNNEDGYNVQFNPVEDKALCFDLMVKHNVVYLEDVAYAGCIDGCGPECGGYYCDGEATGDNPQQAILLAIVDAYEGDLS